MPLYLGGDDSVQKSILLHYDVEIWTDGACINNGTPRARAAWAFVSGDTEMAGLVEGKQTNNVAEGLAIYHALVWAGEQGHKKIKLSTDSQISLFNLQKDPHKVKVNADIFHNIAAVIKKYGLVVQYIKVLGHSGDIGNDRVDKLANSTARG
ncbi:MAG: reverse transcriptase-like protein [Candidatus Levybacteria bacterium]|nr:reverse transcriptase-like protein [Candidatus Levybacteria bacterium]